MAEAYPLQWPFGIKRTPSNQCRRARFAPIPPGRAIKSLLNELRQLGATNTVISSNLPLKSNGMPYASYTGIEDPGIAVYFQLNGKSYAMPCDRWLDVAHNIWAVSRHICAMRGQMRWGVASVEQAFSGFKALTDGKRDCYSILGVSPSATPDEIKVAYRALAKKQHPDLRGSESCMAEINAARDEALGVLSASA